MSVKLEETFREAPPLHFLFKIESFSMLSKKSIVRYESNEFVTGGYQWKLLLFPNGNKNENGGDGHISLYLMLVDSSSDSTSLPTCWGANLFFKLFVFDQIRDRYLIRGDMDGKTRRFHEKKKKQVWGFTQFLALSKFNDPKNGYLVDDTCVFGAEVFMSKPPGNIECCLSMVKESTTVKYSWKIEDFSHIEEECLHSNRFKAGDLYWDLMIHPKGESESVDNSVSLYLNSLECEHDPSLKVYAKFKLRIRDQVNGNHIEFSEDDHWFSAASDCWGWPMFLQPKEMKNKGKGYLVNDTCIVEAEVEVMGVVSRRP